MKVDNQKRVVFITSTLNQVGGGERLLLEGVKYYDKIGIDVHVITWNFDKKALFDGKYKIPNLINFELNSNNGVGDYKFMFNKLLTIIKFRKTLRKLKPNLVISQSENDTTVLNLAQLFLKKNYVTLIFGQMFQFPHDHTKYSLIFKKHLNSIVNSFVGYRESIPLINPSKNFFKNVVVEFWSLLRYFSVKKSISTFVFSKQVQWEVNLLYNINSHILKGAYEASVLTSNLKKNRLYDLRDNPAQKIILMINRLEKKKRTNLAIDAMAHLIKNNYNVKLVIGGRGSQYEILNQQIINLNLQNNVTLLGYINDNEISDIVMNADIFMSLDIGDFDISPFSALALKKPVIWTVEMDMDEDLTNSGLISIVEPHPNNIADAIIEKINKKRLDTSLNEYVFLKNYTWEHYFGTILDSCYGKI